ncbi:Condensin-2 complex subunit CAP-D3 [Linum perenne]
MEEEQELLSRLIANLEEAREDTSSQTPTHPLSRSALNDLHFILNADDSHLLDQFFSLLSLKSLSPSSLLPPLTSAMDSGPVNLSLLSSEAYLSLLLCPNSPVFTLFNPMSFHSLLRSLRRALKSPRPSVQGDDTPSSTGIQVPKRRKGVRGGRNNRGKNVCNDGEDADDGESEVTKVKLFCTVVEKLALVLDFIHLSRFPDCLKSLVQTVVDIPVLASEMLGVSSAFANGLVDLCSRILSRVLKPEHGDEGETTVELFKSLAPLILGVKSQARNFALGFVKNLITGSARSCQGANKACQNLPHYLILKAPDKAEPRGLAVEAIIDIVKVMDLSDQILFADYVVKMTQGKANLRLLAVDLILNLLLLLKDPFGLNTDDELKNSWGFKCLEALIQRSSDSSALTRARALSNLAQMVGTLSSDERNHAILRRAMGLGEANGDKDESRIDDILRRRCMDEKANVRRSALLLVSKLTAILAGNLDGVVLKTMGMACSDPLVSIRKAALSALSQTVRTSSDESAIIEWLHSVPRLIADNETSIQEECENLFLELVLDRVSKAGNNPGMQSSSSLSHSKVHKMGVEKEIELLFPGVLVILKTICNGEVTPWVKKICSSLGKKKRLKPVIATSLQNIIRTSESNWLRHSMPIDKWTAPPGAWLLLSEVSAHVSKAVDWKFLHHHWQLLDKFGAAKECNAEEDDPDESSINSNSVAWAGDRVFLLQTISNVSVELPPEAAADLAHNLLKRIEDFSMHSTEVNAHVKALRTLCKRKAADPTEADTLVVKWVHQVLSKASKILEKYIADNSRVDNENSFFTPPRNGSSKSKKAACTSRLLSEAVTAVHTTGSLVLVCPSADMNNVIPLLYTIITSGNSDPKLSKLPGPHIPVKETAPSLYIQAWLTMGKICLADGKLAKNYIPLFVQELEKSDLAPLRNNLVVTMADFCVRYTALVDCYIPKITKCLRDPCELVRRQTFILLSRLLQRDYVKWRGVLFLRFLLALVDESEKIRQLADFLFGNILKVKAPLLAYNSFVEAVYVLNDCNAHTGSKNTRIEDRQFSIRGNDESSRSKRMHIYVSLLKQMAPEHLLATFAKLCSEILAAASDGMLKLEDVTGQSVLQDAFQILGCKEIRIQTARGSAADAAEAEEEGGGGEGGGLSAKGRAITQAIRKSLIQNTIPIFIELKRLLESKNSPLVGSLMDCLRVLLKDYKNEIDEILIADKQLQRELVYDMHKYEAAKAKSTAAAAATVQNPSSGSFLSPKNKDSRVASAMADAAAEVTARSVLREVNRGTGTPPLSAINVPKLRTAATQGKSGGSGLRTDRPAEVLESVRRRQTFMSDDEN